jgi:hypothetical protein
MNFGFADFDLPLPLKYHSYTCFSLQNQCDCQEIQRVASIDYLGVVLDCKLSWENHILRLNSKLRRAIRTFYFLRNFCSAALLRSIYYSLIDSKIQYGFVCYGSTFKTLINKVRVSQNYFLRIILKKKLRDSSYPMYLELNILPVQHLFIFKVLRIFFIRSGNCENIDSSYFTRDMARGNIRTPKVNKNIFRQAIQYLAPKYLINSRKILESYSLFQSFVKN